MQSLSQVVILNNEGVGLLMQHNHKLAIQKFICALSLVKQLLALPQRSEEADDQELPQFIHDSTHVITGLQDICCFIFANAITLSPQTASCPMSESLANEVSAAILLNVALSYHHAGLTGKQAYICKAESMYETASQLIAINDRRQGTGLLIKAATINNLAQIRYGRGDYNFSLEGFKYLGSLFASFGEVLQRSKCEQDVYRGMLMNALLVTTPKIAAAA